MVTRTKILLAGQDLVLAQDREGISIFPEISVKADARPAYELTVWIREHIGIDAICLSTTSGNNHEFILETTTSDVVVGGGWQWIATPKLVFSKASPTVRRGWWGEFRQWAETTLTGVGMTWTGKHQQHNGGFGHQLIELITTGKSLWFKSGDPVEFGIVQRLAKRYPESLPSILGVSSEWQGWLMGGASGVLLRDADYSAWIQAARHLAELQVLEVGNSSEWIRIGCLNLSPQRILSQMDFFFEGMQDVAKRQLATSPMRLDRIALKKVRMAIEAALASTSHIPPSLVHSDPNPANIFVSSGGCQILDWASAMIAHPFVMLDKMLGHLRKSGIANVAPDVNRAYLGVWRKGYAERQVLQGARAIKVIRFAAEAFLAARWLQHNTGTPPEVDRLLRSLCRSILAETDQPSPVGVIQ